MTPIRTFHIARWEAARPGSRHEWGLAKPYFTGTQISNPPAPVHGSGRMVMAAGERSLRKRRFYAETAQVLAERIGCDVTVPGHHGSFVDKAREFGATLQNVLLTA